MDPEADTQESQSPEDMPPGEEPPMPEERRTGDDLHDVPDTGDTIEEEVSALLEREVLSRIASDGDRHKRRRTSGC